MTPMTSMGPLDDEELRTWHAYAQGTRRLFAQLDRDLQRDAGLPATYWELLGHLADAPGHAMRMSDLAEVTLSAPSRLTHAVSQLEQAGWVRRMRCSTDRRGCFAKLTDEGVAALEAARGSAATSLRAHLFDQLSPAQLAQLRSIGEALVAHLSPGCPGIARDRDEEDGRSQPGDRAARVVGGRSTSRPVRRAGSASEPPPG
jgi:DNA-binding MarR family transcriptional regulator